MKRSYLGLDLIRFMAAAIVMLFHFGFANWQIPKTAAQHALQSAFRPLQGVFAIGWVGVEVFFVLSGFVIAFSASQKNARQFIVGRCARLYPAVWICATATFLVTHKPVGDYLRAMALSPVGPWVSVVYWTLAVEISFYAMVATLLATVGSRHIKRFGIGLGLFSSAFWIARLVDAVTGRHLKWLGAKLVANHWANAALLTYGCYFGLGIMLWSVAREGWTRSNVIVSALCTAAGVLEITATGIHFAEKAGSGAIARYGPTMVWLFALMLIYGSIRHNDALRRRFERRAGMIRAIGLTTYPLYLLHNDIGHRLMEVAYGWGAWTAMGLTVAIMVPAAFLVMQLERFPRMPIDWLAGRQSLEKPVSATLP